MLPAESQVGRRAREGPPRESAEDGWLSTTESGLQASYGKPRFGGAFYVPSRQRS